LTAKTFATWLLSAFYHGIVIYFCIFLVAEIINPNGQNSDQWVLSTFSIVCGVIVVVLRGALSTRHFVPHSHVAYWFSMTIDVFGILFIESQLIWTFPRYYQVMDYAFTTVYLWFIIPIVVVLCLVPDVSVMYYKRQVQPDNWQIIQELGRMEPFAEESYEPIAEVVIPNNDEEGNQTDPEKDEEDESLQDLSKQNRIEIINPDADLAPVCS